MKNPLAAFRNFISQSSFQEKLQLAVLETKQSAVGAVMSVYLAMRPLWSGRDYKAYANEGFRKCIIVYAAINKIQTSARLIPIQLMKGDKKVDDHPLLDLLKKPNPRTTGPNFIESMIGYLLVSGNCYMEMVPGGTDRKALCTPDKLPAELYVQRSDLIKIVPGKLGDVYAYEFQLNGSPYQWVVDPISQMCNIVHIKTWNPTDFFYGMSPLEAAAMSVDTHNEATTYNQHLLTNGAQPSGALTYKPVTSGGVPVVLTPDQRQAVKEQLDSAITGAKNAGRPLILDGQWDWQQMGLSPKDMDWLNTKTVAGKEICMAIGVPPYLMGITDPTYNNAREARAMMFEDTIIPILELILEHLNQNLCPLYGDDFHLEADLNKIMALSPRRAETWTMVNASTCLTTNEKRGLLGFELVDDPAADEIMVSSSIVPLSTKLDPPEPVVQMIDGNGSPIPGNEDDTDSDGDDDLSPARVGAPAQDAGDDNPENDENKPNPSNKPNGKNPKVGITKINAKQLAVFRISKRNIERQALRAILKEEFKYDDKKASDMAALAWGEKGARP